MIEQYIYNLISADATLTSLLTENTELRLYPEVVPSGIEFNTAVTFTLITTSDTFPTIQSRNVQFNIFTRTHTIGAQIADALADLFNEDHLKTSGGIGVVYSQRVSESGLGYDYDDKHYHREATYTFKIK